MERNTLIKRLRGVMAMMLAVLLLAGNPLIAQAASKCIEDIFLNPLQIGDTFNEGDRIFALGTGGIRHVYIDDQLIRTDDSRYYYYDPDRKRFHFPAGQFTLVRIDKNNVDREDMWTYYFETPGRRNSQADDTTPATTITPP